MNSASLTGLEVLKAAWAGQLPASSMAKTIPMQGVAVDHGYVKLVARADERHLNPLGGVHGGFAATVLDSATGCAVHSALEAGVTYGTVDLNVKMLRPIPRDEDLIAEAKVRHLSKTIGVADGTLVTADGKLLAYASATCVIKRPVAE